MLGRSSRVLEAHVQVDGQMRVTVQIRDRVLPLTFWIPANDFVTPSTLERAVELDEMPEDSAARFIMHTFVATVVMAVQEGSIPDHVTELTSIEDRFTVTVCGTDLLSRRR